MCVYIFSSGTGPHFDGGWQVPSLATSCRLRKARSVLTVQAEIQRSGVEVLGRELILQLESEGGKHVTAQLEDIRYEAFPLLWRVNLFVLFRPSAD